MEGARKDEGRVWRRGGGVGSGRSIGNDEESRGRGEEVHTSVIHLTLLAKSSSSRRIMPLKRIKSNNVRGIRFTAVNTSGYITCWILRSNTIFKKVIVVCDVKGAGKKRAWSRASPLGHCTPHCRRTGIQLQKLRSK